VNGLDLFSGIGGIALALEPWVRPIAYCENDRYAQCVLLSRMRDKRLPVASIWDDVRTLTKDHLPFPVDIIYGGFPCQDISTAGRGVGLGGSRSGLFFEIIRLVGELRPAFVFLENSPAIVVRGLDRVLLEFTSLGYDCRWTIVSAGEIGAPHLRERWFLLAHANSERVRVEQQRDEGRSNAVCNSEEAQPQHASEEVHPNAAGIGWGEGGAESGSGGGSLSLGNGRAVHADTCGEGLERWLNAKEAFAQFANGGGGGGGSWPSWLPQPALRRGDAGLSYRVDKLRGVGNACPPAQYRAAFTRLLGIGG
jgi:DNA (cytosine-5)-methyltransferase 1